MIRVSMLGGVYVIIFGIEAGLDFFKNLSEGSGMTFANVISLAGMILMLGIGIASVLSSWYLRRFTRIYGRPLRDRCIRMCPAGKTGTGESMSGRRTCYEIYWEILVYCRTSRGFTAIINHYDLNSKTGQDYIEFRTAKGYLSAETDSGRNQYHSTPASAEYIALFRELYQNLFDSQPEFRL